MQPELLSQDQLEAMLPTIDVEWSVIPGQGLLRVFPTGNFNDGVALVARLGQLAERHDHHPDVHLTFDEVEVTLLTHNAGGITNLDLKMAQAIDKELS